MATPAPPENPPENMLKQISAVFFQGKCMFLDKLPPELGTPAAVLKIFYRDNGKIVSARVVQ